MDTIKTGGLIAQARREKELTQRDLAERLHMVDPSGEQVGAGLSLTERH